MASEVDLHHALARQRIDVGRGIEAMVDVLT